MFYKFKLENSVKQFDTPELKERESMPDKFKLENSVKQFDTPELSEKEFMFYKLKNPLEQFDILELKEREFMPDGLKNPLEQFDIIELISLQIAFLGKLYMSLTNMGVYLIISSTLIIYLIEVSNNIELVKENTYSVSKELIYDTVNNIVRNQINADKGEIFFPFISSLFIFVLINNLISMTPYSFATTSHFIMTFSISFTIVFGATILGFKKHGLEFFSLFVPAGCPLALLPALVLIEYISYLTRNISLGLRLAANIFSGHMLLNILSGFTYNIMKSGYLFLFLGLFPLGFIIAFSGLELGIAFIQSQVFVVLSCSYIKDALELH